MIEPMRDGYSRASDRGKAVAMIKVIGVGGGGCNTVRRMMRARQIPGVEYVAANTDVKSLDLIQGALSVQIGEHMTHGFGAGGDPRVGSRAAEEGEFLLKRAVKDAEMVFVAVGMGGGTGTGASPVVAKIAKDSGAMVIAVVTTPFSFEGKKRSEVAIGGLQQLRTVVDNMIIIHNDKLLQYGDHNTNISEAFKMADDVVCEGIMSVSQLVNVPGEINVDMADVKRVMGIPGVTIMAIGQGAGAHPAMDATEQAMSNPLVDVKMAGAKGLLVSFSGGPDLTLTEITEAGTLVSRECDPACHFKFGLASLSEELRGKSKVTLIATGIRATNPAYATTGTASSSYAPSPQSTPAQSAASSASRWLSGLGKRINDASSGGNRRY
jgi:cell division protein FtsZ